MTLVSLQPVNPIEIIFSSRLCILGLLILVSFVCVITILGLVYSTYCSYPLIRQRMLETLWGIGQQRRNTRYIAAQTDGISLIDRIGGWKELEIEKEQISVHSRDSSLSDLSLIADDGLEESDEERERDRSDSMITFINLKIKKKISQNQSKTSPAPHKMLPTGSPTNLLCSTSHDVNQQKTFRGVGHDSPTLSHSLPPPPPLPPLSSLSSGSNTLRILTSSTPTSHSILQITESNEENTAEKISNAISSNSASESVSAPSMLLLSSSTLSPLAQSNKFASTPSESSGHVNHPMDIHTQAKGSVKLTTGSTNGITANESLSFASIRNTGEDEVREISSSPQHPLSLYTERETAAEENTTSENNKAILSMEAEEDETYDEESQIITKHYLKRLQKSRVGGGLKLDPVWKSPRRKVKPPQSQSQSQNAGILGFLRRNMPRFLSTHTLPPPSDNTKDANAGVSSPLVTATTMASISSSSSSSSSSRNGNSSRIPPPMLLPLQAPQSPTFPLPLSFPFPRQQLPSPETQSPLLYHSRYPTV